ncbi:MAG: hypothetical protein FJY11_02725 [Bacteroidetes bacterium]|nr:hypothetical protein [Bacteroidota bacterium]
MNTRLNKTLILLICLAVFIPATGTDPEIRFQEGVRLYQDGDFNGAIDKWMELNDAGYQNFELLYNTGNAYFKTGELAQAILFYERAALRRPWNDDLNYNLTLARGQIRDRYDEIPVVFFVRWFSVLSLLFTSDVWAYTAIIAFVLTLALILLFLFSSRYRLKTLLFWLSGLMLVVFSSSLSLALRNRNLVFRSREAIIISPVITGRSSPSDGSQDLFVIHEGLKVQTGERIGEWCEIRLPDGNKGWVPSNSFEGI